MITRKLGNQRPDRVNGRQRILPIITEFIGKVYCVTKCVPELLFKRCNCNMAAIRGRVNLVARRPAGQHASSIWRPVPGRQAIADRPPHQHEHVVCHGDIDVSALSGLLAIQQGQQNVDNCRISTAGDVCCQKWRHCRMLGRSHAQGQQTGIPDIIQVMTCLEGARARLAISADRTVNDAGIDERHGVVSEPQPFHHTRPELLDNNVCLADQRQQELKLSLRLQIQCKRQFTPVKHGKTGRVPAPFRVIGSHFLAITGSFNLDDPCASLDQKQCGHGAWQQCRKIENLDPAQWLCGC